MWANFGVESEFAVKNKSTFDYIGNSLKPSFPDGLDVEAFSLNIAKKALARATFRNAFCKRQKPYKTNGKRGFSKSHKTLQNTL